MLSTTAHVQPDDPRRLEIERLLRQPSTWEQRLRVLANGNERVLGRMIPTVYQGETVTERLAAYAADLAFKVRRSYPTLVLGDRVGSGELRLAATGTDVAKDAATVLQRAGTVGYVPGQSPLSQFVDRHRAMLFDGLPERRASAATAELATLSRQYQITARTRL